MDSIKDTEHVPEIPNDGSKILDQSDKTSSFSISSENTDCQNLSSNKNDSTELTNKEDVELSSIKSLSSVGDQLDSNDKLHASGISDGADLSSIKPTVSTRDQFDNNGDLRASGNPDGADLSSITLTISASDQLESSDNLPASGISDGADLSGIKSTDFTCNQLDSNDSLHTSGNSEGAEIFTIEPTVSASDWSGSNDNLHASGNSSGAALSSIKPTTSISDQLDGNGSLHACGNPDGADLSSIKPTVSASDQLDSIDILHVSFNPGGADLSSIKSTVSTSDQSDSNDKLHASGNPDDADLSSITSTPVSDQLDNVNLHATGSSEGADRSSIEPTVSASDRSNSNDNLHASGNLGGAVLSSIKPTASTSDHLDGNDSLHASGNSNGADVSGIKSTVPVRNKSDNDCTSNSKVNKTDKLYDTPDRLVYPTGKFGSYANSNSKSQEPQAPVENTESGVISDRTGNYLFSTDNPGNCDFSSDEPWTENFPKRKSRSSGFFTENIWGSDFSSDNPVSCDFSSDNFSSGKVEYGKDSNNQPQSDDSSCQKLSGAGFSNGKSEACIFSSNKSWNADFSNDKTPMPVSLDVPNEKPVVPKHSNDSLDENSYESGAVTEAFSKLGANSDLLNDNSCSTKESKNSDMSCEIDNAEASSNCFENPISLCKDIDITDSFAIESSEIPSYLIGTSGILGNDPRISKTEKEINDIYISSCKHPEDESREKFDHDIEVTAADGNWKIEKCHRSTVCVLKRIDENAQYKFKCIYFNKGTKLDELFKNKSRDELNVSQDEILECIDSMDEDQLNFIEAPVELNDQSGFLEHRMRTSENENKVAIADWKIEKCHHSTVFVLKRIDENAQYKFKCIYFNKGTKLDELFKNRSNVDLNVSQEEILDCIDSMKDQLNFIEDPVESNDQSGFLEDRMGASLEMIEDSVDNELVHKKAKEQIMSIVDKMLNSMKEDQLNFIEDPVESNDQSGFLEDRMGASLEKIDEDLVDNELVHKKARGQIMSMVDKMLNDEFLAMAKNKENLDVAHLDIETREKELAENDILDELKNVLIYDQIYSNKLDVNLENASNYELIGSQVQDLSGYLSSTETNINDSVNETTNSRIELSTFSIQQKMLNCVKIAGETIFNVMLGVLGYFFQRPKSLISTDCATAQTIKETVTDAEYYHSEKSSTSEPSTGHTKTKAVTSNNLKKKTRITNFSTLFQHLSATAGTDMTAERVMKDINSQVVMDIYSGFHELRIVDYGSLDLMSQCIKGCIVTLRRTLTHSDPIVQKASVLLRKKTHTLEEMRKMNDDLKELTSDAEAHLHSIDRALTGLEDFTDDFMYYKNAISKELVEFLQEDFPEIFN